MQVEGQNSRWVYDGASWCGLYQAQYGAPIEKTQLFAVNLDTRESNLERLDPELLPHQLQPDLRIDDADPAAVPWISSLPFVITIDVNWKR